MTKTNQRTIVCTHCSQEESVRVAANWKRCKKCGYLWCPTCSPSEDQCAQCFGGELISVPAKPS